ncbi:MAG: hypothetical protein ABIH59_01170 [archaeon]
MKREIVFLVLFILPVISAASIEMNSDYSQGETIIAKVSGNFIDIIQEENIFFYRGHVSTAVNYELAKLGEDYYIKADLTGKIPGNYSLKIENIRYYKAGQVTEEDIVANFSISSGFADFSINLGFIIENKDFSITAKNLQDSSITISINIPTEIIADGSVFVGAQQTKNIDFSLGEIEDSLSGNIILSTTSLDYTIPIYIYGQGEQGICGDGIIDSGELCDGDNWGSIIGCENFEFDSGDLSCVFCVFDTTNCFDQSGGEDPVCGNANIDAGEQCDGNNWGAVSGCENFEFDSGDLSCVSCFFDTTDCFDVEEPECIRDSDCEDDEECDDEKCVQLECQDDDDCDNGYECDSEDECVRKSNYCRKDRDCDNDGECEKNECVDKDKECEDDCDKGYECYDAECIKKENYCEDNDDCDKGYECEKKECILKEIIPECTENSDCIVQGEICVSGSCIDSQAQNDCSSLGGEICTEGKKCEGESSNIRGNICCLEPCKKIAGSGSKWIGWSLVIIIIIFLVFFYFKYKGTKAKRPNLAKIGGLKTKNMLRR